MGILKFLKKNRKVLEAAASIAVPQAGAVIEAIEDNKQGRHLADWQQEVEARLALLEEYAHTHEEK